MFFQDGIICSGPMVAHLLTGGHSFGWSEEFNSWVPTSVDMVEKLYSCMWEYCKKIQDDLFRLQIWDRNRLLGTMLGVV